MFDAVHHQAWQAERLQADFCWDLIEHSDLILPKEELPLRWSVQDHAIVGSRLLGSRPVQASRFPIESPQVKAQ